MKNILIITEKPSAMEKIAEAIADKNLKKITNKSKVSYYELKHKGNKIFVVCAVGHLYGLKQEKGKKSEYPVFNIDWYPAAEFRKSALFTKKYLTVIKKLAKDADEFIVATDKDLEGELLGYNILRFACKQKDALRMEFSTMTLEDLKKAFENPKKHVDFPLINAGEVRHRMDWFFGINTSRALTHAIKETGAFKLMSTGRVQGPALKLIVDKEKAIEKFEPDPYWEIQLTGKINKGNIIAFHKLGKIFEKTKATKIFNKCKKEKKAGVIKVEKKQFKTHPPIPFDLTSLQIEAYRCLYFSPKNTLSIAQNLYTKGYISYPRTSSQQLPQSIGYKKIITSLSRLYSKETKIILKKSILKPTYGRKTDPAHPAIYPTGIIPILKNTYEKKLYDLIVRRFLAVFGDPALRETITIILDCKKENFIAKGTTTLKQGWFELYGKHIKLKEVELPKIKEGDLCGIKKFEKLDKATAPPKRYTESSLIKALENENLGTKATRASIIQTLYDRGFIDEKAIRATELGVRTEETLEKYSPRIVEPALTRHFEESMEKIREGKEKPEKVLKESKKAVIEITKQFDKHLKKIGKELLAAHQETRNVMTYVGKCPNCKKGELFIRRGKFGYFIACNEYPECKTIFSIPQVMVKPTKEICEICKHAKVQIIRKRRGPQKICINPKCPDKLKDYSKKEKKELEDIDKGKIEKKCPDCGQPLKLRKSIYGAFLGCSGYPRCKYAEKTRKKQSPHQQSQK